MIYIWDEISGEAKLQRADSTVLASDLPHDPEQDWEMQHVVDLPGGIRIVIEADGRAHTAVLVTVPDLDAKKEAANTLRTLVDMRHNTICDVFGDETAAQITLPLYEAVNTLAE